jgi:hypothetical protein
LTTIPAIAGSVSERPSALVDRDVGDDAFAEQLEDLTGVGVTARGVLRVQEFAVDLDVEHPLRTHHEGEVGDDVLVVVDQVAGRAHGAV